MAEAPNDETELHTEAIKLLLQVAAANDHIHPKEREFLVTLAKAWKVPHVLEALFSQLEQGALLDQPKLSLLRTRPDKVLRAAEALVAVDGEVDVDEDDMISQLKTLLGRA